MADDGYCPACGRYMPMQLNGVVRSSCGCRRTPPKGDVPTSVFVCVACGGHGEYRFGCRGTTEKPHEHCYAIPVHELASMYRVMAGLARQYAKPTSELTRIPPYAGA